MIKEILEKIKVRFITIFGDVKALPEGKEQTESKKTKDIVPFYTKELNINTNLTEEEKEFVNKFKNELTIESFDSIVSYATDTFQKANTLSDAFRWHLYSFASLVEKRLNNASVGEIVRIELEKMFHKQDSLGMLKKIEKIERETELRLIALEEKAKEREKEHKLFGARTKRNDLESMKNSGDRLKINLTSLKMIERAIKNEIELSGIDKTTLENIFKIIDLGSEEDRKKVEEVIKEYCSQVTLQVDFIKELTGKDIDIDKKILSSSIDGRDGLKNKILYLLAAKSMIGLFVEENRKELVGHLEKAKEDSQKISEMAEKTYLYYPQWAKRTFPYVDEGEFNVDPYGYGISPRSYRPLIRQYRELLNSDTYPGKYGGLFSAIYHKFDPYETFFKIDQRLLRIELLYSLMKSDVTQQDIEKLYKSKFHSFINIYDENISGMDNKTLTNEERVWYTRFISEIMHKIYTTEGKETLKFIEETFKTRNPEEIIDNPKLLIEVTKIDRYGKDYIDIIRKTKERNNQKKDSKKKDDTEMEITSFDRDFTFFPGGWKVEEIKELVYISMEIHKKNKSGKSFPSLIHLLYGGTISIPELIYYTVHSLDEKVPNINHKELIKRILEIDELKIIPASSKELKDTKCKTISEEKVVDGKTKTSITIKYPDKKARENCENDDVMKDIYKKIEDAFNKQIQPIIELKQNRENNSSDISDTETDNQDKGEER